MAKYDFPEWPATVPELHRHLEKVGFRCDVRTIRDSIQKMKAVAEIEFPVRAGKKKKK